MQPVWLTQNIHRALTFCHWVDSTTFSTLAASLATMQRDVDRPQWLDERSKTRITEYTADAL